MRLAVVLLLALRSLNPALATPTDLNFKDVEVGSICQTIGVLARFNVIVAPEAARMRLSFAARQVEPLDALHHVCMQAGLQMARVRHEEGSTTVTYMVARPEHIQNAFGKYTRAIQLKYTSAAHVARTLGERIEGLIGNKPSIDERTNRLVLTGTEEALQRVSEILSDMDLPVPQAEVTLSVVTGTAARPVPIWTGRAMATQGRVARLDVSVTGAPKAPGLRLCNLEGKLTARVNSNNFMGLELNIATTLERNGVKTGVRWATELQLPDGEEVVAGTVEVAPGETVTLKVKPAVVKQNVIRETSGGPPVDPQVSQECDLDLGGAPQPEKPSPAPASPSPAPPPPPPRVSGDLDLEGI